MTSMADYPHPADFYDFHALLTDEEREIVLRTRTFMREQVEPIANDAWSRAEFPHDLIKGFAELDIAGLAYRGARSLLTGFLALEMNRVDPSLATFFGVHSGLAMGSIAACGSEEQKDRWLPDMAAMTKIGAFGLTEPDGGSDVAAGLRTTAVRDGDDWILNGRKRWIGNATFADLVVIWARDEQDSVRGFVVEPDMPGFVATKI
jgi:glutaryl-CoA dehydrogenase